jgi:protein-arginine kinase activator protein McsA
MAPRDVRAVAERLEEAARVTRRVKKHTPATRHQTTCRKCRRTFWTTSLGQLCSRCYRESHPRRRRKR